MTFKDFEGQRKKDTSCVDIWMYCQWVTQHIRSRPTVRAKNQKCQQTSQQKAAPTLQLGAHLSVFTGKSCTSFSLSVALG